jgi:ribosomal protein L11 methyltransferase
LEELVRSDCSVLDVGTGSGILTVAAAKLGAQHITAVDIDGHAVRAAQRNFRRTGIAERVNTASGSIPSAATRGRIYDLVVANISARGIRLVAPAVPDLLVHNGVFIASGIIVDQHDEAVAAIAEAGLKIDEIRQKEDWLTILSRHH